MSRTSSSLICLSLTALFLTTGCSSIVGPRVDNNVQYGDPQSVELVSNQFGSTDLQMLAEHMTRSLLQSKPIHDAKQPPALTLAELRNKTSEYIDTRAITEKIRVQLVKSGEVRFVVSTTEMNAQNEELARQTETDLYRDEGKVRIGQMEPAQYRLEGNVSSIVKRSDRTKDVYYLMTLSLIDNETGVLAWTDEKEIRKTSKIERK